jgi:hypothetical protein
MLQYTTTVLEKVAFDRRLFRKEYRKSLKYLNDDEMAYLREWLRNYVLVPVNRSSNGGKSGK